MRTATRCGCLGGTRKNCESPRTRGGKRRRPMSCPSRRAEDGGVATGAAAGAPAAEFAGVVEATGNAEGLRTAVRMTRPRGTVILKSTVHGVGGGAQQGKPGGEGRAP